MENQKKAYSPLYFLAALGSGGLSVSFFMYLQFMIPHKGNPIVTQSHVTKLIQKGNFESVLAALALLFLVFFAFRHVELIIRNVKWYRAFRKSEDFKAFDASPKGMSQMAIPLTLAMTLNIILIVSVLAIPNMWDYIEYLFPVSIAGFLAVGLYASIIFGKQMLRIIINGNTSFVNANNLSHLISIFTFTMISVGFAASGAMSHYTIVNSVGIFFAIFFLSMALVIAGVKLILGFKAMLENGIAKEAAPTFWLVIPILTLIGITLFRLLMGLDHNYDNKVESSSLFIMTAVIVSLQILNGVFGWAIMKKIGYFSDFIKGEKKSVGSLSLICPGVAFFVFGMFFVHAGLVRTGIVEPFSILYFVALVPFVAVQAITVNTFFRLSGKLLRKARFDFS